MTDALITVIIPVYNVEAYLRICLDSVVNQTYKNLEIVVVDDGSTDGSSKICDEYAERDGRIKVVHKHNGGQANARNQAIDMARGDYLTFVDSDDIISSYYVESLYNSAMKFSVKFAICQMISFTTEKTEIKERCKIDPCLIPKKKALEYYCSLSKNKSFFLAACCKLYHKSLFKTLRFPEGCIYEDSLVNYKLIDMVDKIAYLQTPLYYYRIRENSTMGQKEKHDYKIVLKPYQEAIAYFQEKKEYAFADLFYPPLMMREVYRYWVAKKIDRKKKLSEEIFALYKKDLALFKKTKGNFFFKLVFGILGKYPGLYTLYRKMTPGLVGGR